MCVFINVDTSISAICVNDVVFGRLALGNDCVFEIIHLEMSFGAEPPELWRPGVQVCVCVVRRDEHSECDAPGVGRRRRLGLGTCFVWVQMPRWGLR